MENLRHIRYCNRTECKWPFSDRPGFWCPICTSTNRYDSRCIFPDGHIIRYPQKCGLSSCKFPFLGVENWICPNCGDEEGYTERMNK